MSDFENELKICFLDEATQHLDDCEKCFLELEQGLNNPETILKIFRLAHNLKGASQTAGFANIGEFTHELENLLIKIKNNQIVITQETVTLLLECNDHLRFMVGILRKDLNAQIDHTELLEKVRAGGVTKSPPTSPPLPKITEDSVSDVRKTALRPEKTPRLVNPHSNTPAGTQVPQPAQSSQMAPTPTVPPRPDSAPDESIRVSLERLERLNNFVGELVVHQTVLNQNLSQIQSPLLLKTISLLNKITKEVQYISMSCRMIPLRQTFQKLQRTARDLSVALGKMVDLEISGEDTEVDKTVTEHLDDLLIHLVRNSIDHGFETPTDRIELNKPLRGKLKLSAYHRGNQLVFEVQDDGRGLDENKILAKAVKEGLIPAGVDLAPSEIHQLIFEPGFTTKTEVSEVSGRGVGLDSVKKNVETLSGEIQLETAKGQGTLFRVFLPLTLAVMEGLVVSIEENRYVIPLVQVYEMLRLERAQLDYISGKGDLLVLRGETIPLFHLHELLKLQGQQKPVRENLALIVKSMGAPFGVVVEKVILQNQFVMKQLGSEIRDRHGLLGTAILSDGRPAMVLDINDLVRRARAAAHQRLELRAVMPS